VKWSRTRKLEILFSMLSSSLKRYVLAFCCDVNEARSHTVTAVSVLKVTRSRQSVFSRSHGHGSQCSQGHTVTACVLKVKKCWLLPNAIAIPYNTKSAPWPHLAKLTLRTHTKHGTGSMLLLSCCCVISYFMHVSDVVISYHWPEVWLTCHLSTSKSNKVEIKLRSRPSPLF